MTPHRSYILCGTPRSGSTLLCSLLRSSGVAGQPESWFRLPNRAAWAQGWGIANGRGDYAWSDYLSAAISAGTGTNGVFGLRLMWNMLGELVADLGGAPVSQQADLLGRTFGPAQFICLSRRDLVAQAVSRHKAEVSGTWHLGFGEAENPAVPHYDAASIGRYLNEATADALAWEGWFTAQGITPHCVFYEDLADNPAAVAEDTLTWLGLSPRGPLVATNRRMADETSASWAKRFRAETFQSG
jgi:trehalose 2-sulfotransferase